MYPILFEWGPILIPSWHFMYAAGAVAAFLFLGYLNRLLEIPFETRKLTNLYLLCYVAGYFGARLLSIIVEQPEFHSFFGIVKGLITLGPMTFYGGAIASFIAGAWYTKKSGFNLRDAVDVSIPSGLLALAIGRIGCFLNGDDYGSVIETAGGATPWWAVVFPNLTDQLPRYPVQLWETGAVLTLVILSTVFFRRIRKTTAAGMIGYICIVFYANLRFGLEFFRGDFRGHPFSNWMSTSQLISIIVLLICAGVVPALIKGMRNHSRL